MFEELIEKINTIEANVNLLLELHIEQSNSLTTYNDVAKFLGLTRKTIYNYIKEGKFVQDKHFYKNSKGTPPKPWRRISHSIFKHIKQTKKPSLLSNLH